MQIGKEEGEGEISNEKDTPARKRNTVWIPYLKLPHEMIMQLITHHAALIVYLYMATVVNARITNAGKKTGVNAKKGTRRIARKSARFRYPRIEDDRSRTVALLYDISHATGLSEEEVRTGLAYLEQEGYVHTTETSVILDDFYKIGECETSEAEKLRQKRTVEQQPRLTKSQQPVGDADSVPKKIMIPHARAAELDIAVLEEYSPLPKGYSSISDLPGIPGESEEDQNLRWWSMRYDLWYRRLPKKQRDKEYRYQSRLRTWYEENEPDRKLPRLKRS